MYIYSISYNLGSPDTLEKKYSAANQPTAALFDQFAGRMHNISRFQQIQCFSCTWASKAV